MRQVSYGALVLITTLSLGCGSTEDSLNGSSEMYYPGPTPSQDPLSDQQPQEGDKFESPGANPFVIAAHDPLSTFAADVDTASYDIFRRDILRGALPDPASVRLEEYVNYFPYAYPAPSADAAHPFAVNLRAAPSPYSNTTLLAVGIKGQEFPEDAQRKPTNLVFLIDVSGSMTSPDKLPLVKTVLRETLEVLAPQDTVAIVTYAGSTEVRLGPTMVAARSAIENVIDKLESGGSTAGAAGITLAYEQAEAGYIEGGLNHVLLCTDGDFNVGASSNQELVQLIEQKRESGVTLTVLGFGYGNLNDAMMEAVSNAGNGIYGVIADEDQAVSYVHQRMLATLRHIAKDVKLQLVFNPAQVYAYRLLGYENRDIPDDQFRDDALDAGEIGAGHTVTALYELVLPGGTIPQRDSAPEVVDGPPAAEALELLPEELCRLQLRYKQPGASSDDPASELSHGLQAGALAADFQAMPPDFRWAWAVASFAEILRQSPYARAGSLEAISQTLAAAAESYTERQEACELFASARELLGQRD